MSRSRNFFSSSFGRLGEVTDDRAGDVVLLEGAAQRVRARSSSTMFCQLERERPAFPPGTPVMVRFRRLTWQVSCVESFLSATVVADDAGVEVEGLEHPEAFADRRPLRRRRHVRERSRREHRRVEVHVEHVRRDLRAVDGEVVELGAASCRRWSSPAPASWAAERRRRPAETACRRSAWSRAPRAGAENSSSETVFRSAVVLSEWPRKSFVTRAPVERQVRHRLHGHGRKPHRAGERVVVRRARGDGRAAMQVIGCGVVVTAALVQPVGGAAAIRSITAAAGGEGRAAKGRRAERWSGFSLGVLVFGGDCVVTGAAGRRGWRASRCSRTSPRCRTRSAAAAAAPGR